MGQQQTILCAKNLVLCHLLPNKPFYPISRNSDIRKWISSFLRLFLLLWYLIHTIFFFRWKVKNEKLNCCEMQRGNMKQHERKEKHREIFNPISSFFLLLLALLLSSRIWVFNYHPSGRWSWRGVVDWAFSQPFQLQLPSHYISNQSCSPFIFNLLFNENETAPERDFFSRTLNHENEMPQEEE